MGKDVSAADLTKPAKIELAETKPVSKEISVPTPSVPAAPCGLALVDEKKDVATIQRLLKMAWARTGLVDGIMGRKTKKAIESFVGVSDTSPPTEKVIAHLDSMLCEKI